MSEHRGGPSGATSGALTAVITIVHGRAEHLRAQRASLGTDPPDVWVVVAMDDPSVRAWHSTTAPVPDVVDVPVGRLGLPLAAARNAGARRARELGADVLVFLDVDCLAGNGLVSAYAEAVRSSAGAAGSGLWCGPVTYLPPPPAGGYDLDRLAELDDPHPARPAPRPGEVVDGHDWRLFWSLSFALHVDDFERVGGFDEGYMGYGGEDTDFAWSANRAGLTLTWVGAARAYHQHHPVSSPPVEHRVDIVRNATRFHDRWGEWAMIGWLHELAELGWVHEADGAWQVRR